MNDYKSSAQKIIFSDRIGKVMENIKTRLKPYEYREGTYCSPAPDVDVNPFVDVFNEMPDAPLIIAQAHGIVRSWMVTPAMIFPHEAVVGITRPFYGVREHFSWGLYTGNVRPSGKVYAPDEEITDEERAAEEALRKRMNPGEWSHMHNEGIRRMGETAYQALCDDRMFSAGGYQGHTVPSYDRLLTMGLDGVLEYIDECAKNHPEKEAQDMYEASRVIVRGMSDWLTMYADKAAELAKTEEDATQKKYYEEISENCRFVAHNKPVTLYNAVQLMWCLSLWDYVDCVGRVDQYLYPFYKYSMEHGDVIPPEDSLVSIIFKIWENGSHNVTISGVTPDGKPATNELTYLCLQTIRNIHDVHPRMSVRITEDIPDDLIALVTTMWSEGMSDPTIVSDKTVIKGLVDLGTPIEDARDYSMLGCQEIEIQGKTNFGCEDGVFNVAKVFEIAMHGGRSISHPDVQIGPETGNFVDFETFDDFYAAYFKQLEYFTDIFIDLCNRGQELRAMNFAKVVKTPFTVGCLEKGKFHDDGGPVYNYGCIETAGTTVVADSMTAIKKLVFEEKLISKETLADALAKNFEGYEKERQLLLNRAPKFGNDDDEADSMAVKVLDDYWTLINKYKSVRGGNFTGACSLLQGGIHYGKAMGAMPDGRFAGEPLGNTIGARPGADKSGSTALLKSVSKLPLDKGVGGTTLNVLFTQKLLSNPALREKIGSTIKAYALNGGQMAQITTANYEDLLDAKEHPERHGDLIVRIGGFSIQFVRLDPDSQNEVISRYAE